MPAAVAARSDDDLLDTNVGRTFRLELDPIAVQLNLVGEVRSDESLRRPEMEPYGSESDSRDRSDDRNPDDRSTPLLPRDAARSSRFRRLIAALGQCSRMSPERSSCSVGVGPIQKQVGWDGLIL
jgi:hypothetical protein